MRKSLRLRTAGEPFEGVCEATGACGQAGMYDILDFVPLPMAIMEGAGHYVRYANPALCDLTGISKVEIVGKPFAEILPEGNECLSMLDRVYRTGASESHTEQKDAEPHRLYWSYEVWPVVAGPAEDDLPVGVMIQMTDTALFDRRVSAMNEALLVSAVRQHELRDAAETLNTQLEMEIKERKRAEVAIESLAFYDSLTKLPNRRLLLERLQQASIACARTLRRGAIFVIDLDDFKALNDTRGHDTGDLLLQQVAQRLTTCVRESDTVARLGGDEFVVLLENLSREPSEAAEQAKVVGEKILIALNKRYLFGAQEYRSTGSVGATLFSKNRESVEVLLKRADLALYCAKAAGAGVLRFFEPEMQVAVTARDALETALRLGLQEGQFVLYYQPQVDFDGRLTGAEALLRWQHPSRGLLSPEEFIPLAEEKGFIVPLGLWMLETACTQLVTWSANPNTAHLTLAINVSAQEFRQPELVPRMLQIIDRVGANPERLILGFTESLMLGSVEDTISKMNALKARGLRFSLDDFGIGYSSLTYLKNLPLDQLKIDRSFVRDILTNHNDAAIVCTIITLGKCLGLSVIADGIETEGQRDFLAANGCRAYQGFLFGRPEPVEGLRLSCA